MDIYRELGPKVRPAIEGPYHCATRINFPAWVPLTLIVLMVGAALALWR